MYVRYQFNLVAAMRIQNSAAEEIVNKKERFAGQPITGSVISLCICKTSGNDGDVYSVPVSYLSRKIFVDKETRTSTTVDVSLVLRECYKAKLRGKRPGQASSRQLPPPSLLTFFGLLLIAATATALPCCVARRREVIHTGSLQNSPCRMSTDRCQSSKVFSCLEEAPQGVRLYTTRGATFGCVQWYRQDIQGESGSPSANH